MPKSYDEPDELDPVELQRIAREAKERAARRKHQAYESSDPPPPVYRPRQTSVVDIHIEEAGKRAKHLKEIWALVAVVVAALVAAGLWVQSRPSKEYVDQAEARAKAAASEKDDQIQRLAESNARIEQQVKDMRENDDRRWDKLDKILERQFGQTTSTAHPPLPAFGPAAKAKGRP